MVHSGTLSKPSRNRIGAVPEFEVSHRPDTLRRLAALPTALGKFQTLHAISFILICGLLIFLHFQPHPARIVVDKALCHSWICFMNSQRLSYHLRVWLALLLIQLSVSSRILIQQTHVHLHFCEMSILNIWQVPIFFFNLLTNSGFVLVPFILLTKLPRRKLIAGTLLPLTGSG